MLTLTQIQTEAFRTSCAKGWHDKPIRSVVVGQPARIDHDRVLRSHALMHSELTEALDEYDVDHISVREVDGKPEGMVVELADVVVRVGDTMQALGFVFNAELSESWWSRALDMRGQRVHGSETLRQFDHARRSIDRATESVRVDDWTKYIRELAKVVKAASRVAALQAVDLPQAIEVKLAYNRTRPQRHGGKQA